MLYSPAMRDIILSTEWFNKMTRNHRRHSKLTSVDHSHQLPICVENAVTYVRWTGQSNVCCLARNTTVNVTMSLFFTISAFLLIFPRTPSSILLFSLTLLFCAGITLTLLLTLNVHITLILLLCAGITLTLLFCDGITLT